MGGRNGRFYLRGRMMFDSEGSDKDVCRHGGIIVHTTKLTV